MKKLLITLVCMSKLLLADYVQMQTLLDTQSAIATAVNSFVEARGAIPANVNVLKSVGYLPSGFNAVNPVDGDAITFTIGSNEIRINSALESSKLNVDDIDYYTNTFYNREFARFSRDEGGTLVSYYSLTSNANTNNLISSWTPWAHFKGDSQPQTYLTPSAGSFWFSSTYENDTYQLFTYTGLIWESFEKTNKNFISALGIYQNQFTIPLLKSSWQTSNVTVNTQQKAITCATAGTTYNPLKDRCEAYTSNACSTGDIFNTSTGKCELGTNSACTYNGGTWNGTTCQKGSSYSATKTIKSGISYIFATSDNCYGDFTGFYATTTGSLTNGIPNVVFTPENGCGTASMSYSGNTSLAWTSGRRNCTGWYRFTGGGSSHYSSCTDNISFNSDTCTISNSVITYGTAKVRWTNSIPNSCDYTCSFGGTLSGTTCSSIEYFEPSCDAGYAHDGQGRCVKSPTCTAKTMPVAPFYATPYYGNNGVCYSDAGMYCKTTGVNMDGLYTCFNTSQTCNDSSYTLRSDTDVCEKYSFTCNASQKRYGLPESPTNNNPTDLYNRITNKDTKLNAIVATILGGNVDVNDNAGAMCTQLTYTTFSQPTTSPDYNIGGETKSGF